MTALLNKLVELMQIMRTLKVFNADTYMATKLIFSLKNQIAICDITARLNCIILLVNYIFNCFFKARKEIVRKPL